MFRKDFEMWYKLQNLINIKLIRILHEIFFCFAHLKQIENNNNKIFIVRYTQNDISDYDTFNAAINVESKGPSFV